MPITPSIANLAIGSLSLQQVLCAKQSSAVIAGYGDAVAHITIPLIIALFAFAMPLLFQVITHINSKYSSEALSKMFENSLAYKAFWGTSVFSIVFLIAFGATTLLISGECRESVIEWFSWISVFVAFVYSCAILLFLRTCIRFNSPEKLLVYIEKQYRAELRYDDIRLAVKNFSQIKNRLLFWRTKGWKSFQSYIYRMARLFNHYQTKEDFGKRWVDICKYSLATRNNQLMFSIMMKVDEIAKSEKHSGRLCEEFDAEDFTKPYNSLLLKAYYDGVMEYYNHAETNRQFEDWMVWRKFSAIKKSRFPWEKDVVDTVRSIILSVESGHIGVYERYIDRSSFDYLYILDLPNVAYVESAEEREIIDIENKRKEAWEMLCNLHFAMNAFLFSQGHLDILPSLLSARYYMTGHLYDLSPQELLVRYVKCKKIFHEDYFGRWPSMDIFGRHRVEGDILEQFVSAMVLLNSETGWGEQIRTSHKNVEQFKNFRKAIVEMMERQKCDKKLCSMYPGIESVNPDEKIDACIKSIIEPDGGKDIYRSRRPAKRINLLESDILNVFRNTGWMPAGLKESVDKGSLERISLQTYTTRMRKEYVLQYNEEDSFHLQRGFEILFEQRALYMMYAAISKMDIKQKKVKPEDFEKVLSRYTKRRNGDYVILDTECDMSIRLDVDTSSNCDNWTYKGAAYKKLFLNSREFLGDSTLPNAFRNKLLILRKKDFPSLVKINENTAPQVRIEDVSDRNEGIAAIRVTIVPNMEMRYYKNTKVLQVELER